MKIKIKKLLLVLVLFFVFLIKITYSINQLIKIQLNESSNVFLLNLSEKGLDIDISEYKAYLNSTTTLDNLSFIFDFQNNYLYLWYNNTSATPFDVFYLAREGESNIGVFLTGIPIKITNPNNYDLTNY
ncbi:MAG TPA: hypothetical protein EYH56_01410 [Nanoarchaeota archaeon]|nr:hypothetical protein [Nanoarchaeota archaeon]